VSVVWDLCAFCLASYSESIRFETGSDSVFGRKVGKAPAQLGLEREERLWLETTVSEVEELVHLNLLQ
jgi:hypothetical protein